MNTWVEKNRMNISFLRIDMFTLFFSTRVFILSSPKDLDKGGLTGYITAPKGNFKAITKKWAPIKWFRCGRKQVGPCQRGQLVAQSERVSISAGGSGSALPNSRGQKASSFHFYKTITLGEMFRNSCICLTAEHWLISPGLEQTEKYVSSPGTRCEY